MKTKAFLLFFLSIGLFACSDKKDDNIPSPDQEVSDPEGTVWVSLMNESSGNNDFKGIRISDAGNFYSDWAYFWTFSGVGNMRGLGNIATIPQNGYVDEYSVRTGCGYVGKENIMNMDGSYECNFIRIWVESVSMAGAEIKYQYPFKGLNKGIQLTSDVITLENTDFAYGIVAFKDMAPFKASIKETAANEWLFIGPAESGAFSVVAFGNNDVSSREATIIIKGDGSSDTKTIKVTQQGAKAFISIPEDQQNISAIRTASTGKIYMSSNVNWTVKSDASWCTVAPLSGNGDTDITYSIQQNNSGEKRVANITFSAQGVEDVKVVITQDLFFSGGSGILGDPYIVTNAEQLALVSQFSNSYFRVTKDIDLTEYLKNYASGWEPFAFSGDFDGNGHTISGLWIDRSSTQDVGLFSQLPNGEIANLTINISSKGIVGGENTGGIAGSSFWSSSISNCSVNGTITGTVHTGGIIGSSSANSSSIVKCKYNGTISGINTGGIIGYNGDGSFINQSYSQGNINGTIIAGGLVGVCTWYGNITDSYSTAKVSVNGFNYACYAGGILGQGQGQGYYSTISRCYYAGSLNVSFSTGGSERKVGITGEGPVSSSFYDSSIAGENVGDTSHGRTTAEMKQKSTYSDWDFDNIWKISEGVSYPTLR